MIASMIKIYTTYEMQFGWDSQHAYNLLVFLLLPSVSARCCLLFTHTHTRSQLFTRTHTHVGLHMHTHVISLGHTVLNIHTHPQN